jgi:hypothetical protein
MHGINKSPLPSGVTTNRRDGGITVKTASGHEYTVRANGTLRSHSDGRQTVNFRPDGRVSAIHTATVDIQHGVHGERTVRSIRPDHSILVSTGVRNGYLERNVVVNNRTIIQRTYVTNGRVFSRTFLSYSFRGGYAPLYVPAVYFGPAFYGWAFYPWATPVVYAWGWGSQPWFGYYSGYFQPYPSYLGPTAWLADYFLSRTLADAYAAQNQAPPPPGNGYAESGQAPDGELYAQADTPITPALRDAIADEVRRQLAYENAISSGTAQQTVEELPNALKPGRIFVVATPLQVSTTDGQTCDLSPADVLQLNAEPAPDSPDALLQVASGKRQDCPAGVSVSVQLQDLAEMQNNLRAQMDAGLDALHSGQGQGGLPQAPPSAMAAAPRPAMLDVQLPPDPNVAGLLDVQQQDAQRTEQAAVQLASNTNQ